MTNSENCIFCKIVRGEIPATVVYEDEVVLAFMDIYPVSKGHCLLIPKTHYENMFDVDPDVAAHLGKQLARLTTKVKKALTPGGVLNVVANGTEAGQEVPHLHFHVIPRNKGAPFGFRFPPNYRDAMAPREELESVSSLIRDA